MSLVKKLKDILFEVEEDETQPVKIREEEKKEEPIKIEPVKETKNIPDTPKASFDSTSATSERELFRSDNTFKFPDFDEEEFASSMAKPKQNTNVLEYERKKSVEKRNEYNSKYERSESREYGEKKKFKPSPIISPVYGILNQDYRAEDIVNKSDVNNSINIDEVRKKAFEPKKEIKVEEKIETIDEPVVTFFEEKNNDKLEDKNNNYKSIDDLLEDASEEISLEDTLELPKTNNLDAIEEELEKIEEEEKDNKKDIDDNLKDPLEDTLDNDLFELIDSMYDEREEG